MKNNIKWLAAVYMAIFTIGFYSCDDGYDLTYKGGLGLNLLELKQASELWNGRECNLFTELSKSNKEADNFSYKLNIALYQNRNADKNATVNLIVNKDSLSKVIAKAKAGEDGAYEKYKEAELLPEEFYLLPSDKLELLAGTKLSDDLELLVYSEKMISLVQKEERNMTFVLPLKIVDSSSYTINDKVNSLMLFFQVKYVAPETGPEYLPDPNPAPEELSDNLKLVWNEEFNYEGVPNPDVWRFEEGFQRNQELQWYSDKNGVCDGEVLVITGKRERVDNPNYQAGSSDWKTNREYAEYTSSSIVTKEYRFRKGTMLVRAKIPTESGAWPAIWTTGGSKDSWCWEWPLGGEIDILEYYFVNGVQSLHANACWGSDTRWSAKWDSYNRPLSDFTKKDANWAEKYHIWRMDWDDNYIKLYLDDELMNEIDLSKTNNGSGGLNDWWRGSWRNPFKDAGNDGEGFGQQLFLNLALGGNGGTPAISKFPLEYKVDYVRVYQNK